MIFEVQNTTYEVFLPPSKKIVDVESMQVLNFLIDFFVLRENHRYVFSLIYALGCCTYLCIHQLLLVCALAGYQTRNLSGLG